MVKTGLSRLNPDWVILNPIDSEGYDLLKNDIGTTAAATRSATSRSSSRSGASAASESEAVERGTAHRRVTGPRRSSSASRCTVLTADQHSDFFVRNLVVILFEERVAFPIYFPTAFVELTLADWPDFVGS
jgi:hypothetical protein